MRAALPVPGDTLGRFRLSERLGKGAVGTVFVAEDTVLDGERVCLKVIHPSVAKDKEILSRVKREVLLARRIAHPGVCSIFDIHEENGFTFLSMDFIAGETLLKHVQQNGALGAKDGVLLAEKLCEAIAAAHAVDVIHRDLKPANIMLKPDGTVVVLDFGIATATNAQGDLTQPGMLLGTQHYMAPELWQGQSATKSTDLFALGVVIYNTMTARMPWARKDGNKSPMALMERGKPIAPSELIAELPPSIEEAVLRSIALDPAERFESADEMALVFAKCLEDINDDDLWMRTTASDLPHLPIPSEADPNTDTEQTLAHPAPFSADLPPTSMLQVGESGMEQEATVVQDIPHALLERRQQAAQDAAAQNAAKPAQEPTPVAEQIADLPSVTSSGTFWPEDMASMIIDGKEMAVLRANPDFVAPEVAEHSTDEDNKVAHLRKGGERRSLRNLLLAALGLVAVALYIGLRPTQTPGDEVPSKPTGLANASLGNGNDATHHPHLASISAGPKRHPKRTPKRARPKQPQSKPKHAPTKRAEAKTPAVKRGPVKRPVAKTPAAKRKYLSAQAQLKAATASRGVRSGDLPRLDYVRGLMRAAAKIGAYGEAAGRAKEAKGIVEAAPIDRRFVSRKLKRFNAAYDKSKNQRARKKAAPLLGTVLMQMGKKDFKGANATLNRAFSLLRRG